MAVTVTTRDALIIGAFCAIANLALNKTLFKSMRESAYENNLNSIDVAKYLGSEKPTAREFVDKLNAVINDAVEKRTTDDVNNIKVKILDKEFTVEELQRVAEYVQDNPNKWLLEVNKFLDTQQKPATQAAAR